MTSSPTPPNIMRLSMLPPIISLTMVRASRHRLPTSLPTTPCSRVWLTTSTPCLRASSSSAWTARSTLPPHSAAHTRRTVRNITLPATTGTRLPTRQRCARSITSAPRALTTVARSMPLQATSTTRVSSTTQATSASAHAPRPTTRQRSG